MSFRWGTRFFTLSLGKKECQRLNRVGNQEKYHQDLSHLRRSHRQTGIKIIQGVGLTITTDRTNYYGGLIGYSQEL
ncbi:MAG: hypothetical protein KME06_00450 [Kastovskya adunca ATA6-11-RM4]|nr:hypothetical protein [Kastovskya adunca ATA6-11-RM4]